MLGGRLTSIRVGWDNGPRVYYTDAFTDGEFGMFRADASGAPSAPGAPSPSSSGSVPTGSVRELEIDISTAEVVIQPGDAYDLQVSGSRVMSPGSQAGCGRLRRPATGSCATGKT